MWIVALQHSGFSFDVAYNSSIPGVGLGFGNLTGIGKCGEWVDLDLFAFGFCYCVELGTAACDGPPAPLTCDEIINVQAGFGPSPGLLKGKVTVSGDHDGESITFTVDGIDVTAVISGGEAFFLSPGQSVPSEHDIFISSPDCCGQRRVFFEADCQ